MEVHFFSPTDSNIISTETKKRQNVKNRFKLPIGRLAVPRQCTATQQLIFSGQIINTSDASLFRNRLGCNFCVCAQKISFCQPTCEAQMAVERLALGESRLGYLAVLPQAPVMAVGSWIVLWVIGAPHIHNSGSKNSNCTDGTCYKTRGLQRLGSHPASVFVSCLGPGEVVGASVEANWSWRGWDCFLKCEGSHAHSWSDACDKHWVGIVPPTFNKNLKRSNKRSHPKRHLSEQ